MPKTNTEKSRASARNRVTRGNNPNTYGFMKSKPWKRPKRTAPNPKDDAANELARTGASRPSRKPVTLPKIEIKEPRE